MMACPCAQEMVRAQAEARLREHGLDAGRHRARCCPWCRSRPTTSGAAGGSWSAPTAPLRAEDLVEIVEGSMSSENYDLLKRPDELFVVEKAHRHPRFVEDTVREMLRSFVDTYPELPDDAYVHARQVNMETIHKHDVFAQRGGRLGEIRRRARGRRAARQHHAPGVARGPARGLAGRGAGRRPRGRRCGAPCRPATAW